MITTCTNRRACVRHLARGVAGPTDDDPCGALTAADLATVRAAALEQHDLALTRQAAALALSIVAVAEQLAAVTAERDAAQAVCEDVIAEREQARTKVRELMDVDPRDLPVCVRDEPAPPRSERGPFAARRPGWTG